MKIETYLACLVSGIFVAGLLSIGGWGCDGSRPTTSGSGGASGTGATDGGSSAGSGGSGTGGAGSGGTGAGGRGSGGASAGSGGAGSGGRGGAGSGGSGTDGGAGGAGSGGRGGAGSGGSGTGGSAGGSGGAGGQPGVSYSGCSFGGGIVRLVVAKRDTQKNLCVVLVLDQPGTNPFNLTLPQSWGMEFAFAMPATAASCLARFPPAGSVAAIGGTGTVGIPPTPTPVAMVDVTLTFPADAGVGPTERLLADSVTAPLGCP
jgi:hypothetical protein